MRSAVLALALIAAPAFARSSSNKPPKKGQFCKDNMAGTSMQDAKGNTLKCKADKKGKLRWQP